MMEESRHVTSSPFLSRNNAHIPTVILPTVIFFQVVDLLFSFIIIYLSMIFIFTTHDIYFHTNKLLIYCLFGHRRCLYSKLLYGASS